MYHALIEAIDVEIAKLRKVRALLAGVGGLDALLGAKTSAVLKPQRHNMSPEGRARIAEAQKRRWAAARGAAAQPASQRDSSRRSPGPA